MPSNPTPESPQGTKNPTNTPAHFIRSSMIDASISTVVTTAIYPLSVIWTTQQQTINGKYPNFRQAAIFVHKNRSWYSGFRISATSAIPGNFAYLGGRSAASHLTDDRYYTKLIESPVSIACGMIFWAPAQRTSLIQQVQAVKHNKPQSTQKVMRNIISKDGVAGLYRGTGLYAMVFALSDFLGTAIKLRILDSFNTANNNTFLLDAFATFSGFALSALFTIPIEAALLPYMTQETQRDFKEKLPVSRIVSDTYRKNGIRGFTRGILTGATQLGLFHLSLTLQSAASRHLLQSNVLDMPLTR